MRILSVYVDITNQNLSFEPIAKYISTFNAGVRVGERLWFVKTVKKPAEVSKEISELSLSDDYDILVFEVGEKWATYSASDEVKSWMGKHI